MMPPYEEWYGRLANTATECTFTVYLKDGHPVGTVHSPSSIGVCGYTPEDFEKDPYLWINIVHVEDREAVETQARHVIFNQKIYSLEHRIIKKNGRLGWVKRNLIPHRNDEGKVSSYDGLLQDITEKRQLNDQLQQAKNLEAIGNQTSAIVNDFNNILMAIQGTVSLIRYKTQQTDTAQQMLKSIEKYVKQMTIFNKKLLNYARKVHYNIRSMDLNKLVLEVSEFFSKNRHHLSVQNELDQDLPKIQADEAQMKQMLMNLLVNASDAMLMSGTVILRTAMVTDADMRSSTYVPIPGSYILLTVKDTGVGMDEETLEHVFEPFFTTKKAGRGAGLGLASVYGIVKGHGGYIDLDSKEGRGTTFSIYLPAVRNACTRNH